jgi:lysylphosphatidylglycerol synthetase-like protein (DUF2156 family)
MGEIDSNQAAERRARIFEAAPPIYALVAFLIGALMLLRSATPSLIYPRGLSGFEHLIAELPELSASIGGVALMALATGLQRRLDGAWAAATALLFAVAIYALARHGHLILSTLCATIALLLIVSRRAFYRRSRLVEILPNPSVALAICGAFSVAIVGGLLWAGERPDFAQAPWWSLLLDPHLGRPGRALASAGAAFGFILVTRYLTGHRRSEPPLAQDEDLAHAERIIIATPDSPPDAQLAFTGDKSFLFADDAFVMHARGGGALIAMIGPIGPKPSWRQALLAFRDSAQTLSLRPVIYAAPPELLPDLLDLGFRPEKVGENAMIDLAAFSLKGSAKQNLRTARNRMVERQGATFEVRAPPHELTLWDELKPLSDRWLKSHGGEEKGFSLGAFGPDYLARHVIAIVRRHGAPVAFANIWLSPDGARAALDLMRFDPENAPPGVMDFLFTEMLLWAQARGVKTFDLGMAPLSGLAEDRYASLFARIGKLAAQVGEPLYGFEGLRVFKSKFGPRWEPRYIAAPGAWTLPLVLADVAMLTNRPST